MTLNNLLAWAEEMRPSAYSQERLTEWIEDLESALWEQVLLQWRIEELYTLPDDGDKRLLLPDRWRPLYTAWLGAMIDYANGEYTQYENELTQFNSYVNQLAAWYAQNYAPADNSARWRLCGTLTGGGSVCFRLPPNAAVLTVECEITEPFDGEGAITLGTEAEPTLLLDGADICAADMRCYRIQRLVIPPAGEKLLLQAPEDSTEGSALVHLLIQMPVEG
ncbi:MAG: hypothetical protein LUC89_08645 [Oscillospiraceae bacterium]|nr:hypothetical protein [Oscillospiraceae bacterium]